MIQCIDAGCVPYPRSLEWQRTLAEKRRNGDIQNHLLLLEHPPVYTFGRRNSSADLLIGTEKISKMGIKVYKTDRGGRITYHGPGQLVGYLIFTLKEPVPDFVWKIEESLLRLLEQYHLEGERDEDHPGVWIGKRKIAAIGLHIERNVTTHGFSLNVNCDLKPFRYILPCGIPDRDVTSLEKELGWSPPMRDVKDRLSESFSDVFKTSVTLGANGPTQPE